jgi:hypothetical protein
VSGFVYIDTNKNGVKDTGESGYQGATVSYQQGGFDPTPITSGASGSYSFSVPQNTNWTVSLTVPNSYVSSDGVTSRPVNITTIDAPGINFGIVAAPTSAPSYKISGYVFIDSNSNGIRDGSPLESCYNGTVDITCCNATNTISVSSCVPPLTTWCTCSDPNTSVTIHPPTNYSATGWSGTDVSGHSISGKNASAYVTLFNL